MVREPRAAGEVWTRHTFGAPLNNLAAPYNGDGDGDLDARGTQGQGSDLNADFDWARNQGDGTFDVFTNVATGSGDFLQGTSVDRFQGGVLEATLSWHASDAGVQALSVFGDPAGEPWLWRELSPTSLNEELTGADLDDDGDEDLVLRERGGETPPLSGL